MKNKLKISAIDSNIAHFTDDSAYVEIWTTSVLLHDENKLKEIVKAYNMHDELLEITKEYDKEINGWEARGMLGESGKKHHQKIKELIKKAEQ